MYVIDPQPNECGANCAVIHKEGCLDGFDVILIFQCGKLTDSKVDRFYIKVYIV
ncbi:hypothetical protein VSA01S_05160 [Vibrio sagamiensis NBRC 104589]|uniref:Uncharacterized protein n=1 Tax=Vibrio sagamiensis NBRC 104589 TaxID=1219064 RepID=A0A511QAS7_9VIBR|nr:hypothetical protein VSA01S_05160 [Vibrio sagamiensis NBRC 104589]